MDEPEQIYGRHRVWDSKDTLPRELQFLQPLNASTAQFTRIMVGPRQILTSQDAADQTLTTSQATLTSFGANDLVPNSWTKPPANAGVLWEAIRYGITARDASGKIQLTIPSWIAISTGINAVIAPGNSSLPFTMPPINTALYEIRALVPMPASLPVDPPLANGPSCSIGLVNTDGAASHVYRRFISYVYRYIFDIDTSKERVYVMGTLV